MIDKKQIYKNRTYCLSETSIAILEKLVQEFSQRLGSQMSLNKLVDALIFYCKDVTFADVVNKTRKE